MTAAADSPIAVTILGGYLGSGKTTRVNELLAGWSGDPIVVVVNDFGAVNIDAALIRSQGENLVELENGCVCCSLAQGMAVVMDQLAAMKRRPGHVVIEVSGVGDPAGVAKWARIPGFELNAIVVCADVETIRRRAEDRWVADTVVAQLRSADIILLTKTDLITSEFHRDVEKWFSATIPDAHVTSEAGTLAALLRMGTARPDGEGVSSPGVVALDDGTDEAHSGHALDSHRSWSVSTTQLIDVDRLHAFLAGLPEQVVRGKGVVRTRQAPDRRTVVQLAGRRIEIRQEGPWEDPVGRSTLVLIASADPQVPADLDRQMADVLDSAD